MGFRPLQGTGAPAEYGGGGHREGAAPRHGPGYRSLLIFGLLAASFLLSAACTPAHPQSTFDPAGPVAQGQMSLFFVLFWVMLGVFVVVEGILLYAIIRYRRRPGQAIPRQVHGHTRLEIAWTLVPTVLILGVGAWSVVTLFALEKPPAVSAGDALEVNVTGHQWWWEFEYPNADGSGKRVTTANELRIPVDRPVVLNLRSDDVVHSFWVPKLAGKLDVVPTRTNRMWLQADSDKVDALPKTFYGQCAEFCGIAHALMRFRVQALSQEGYSAWVQSYGRPPVLSREAERGREVFLGKGTCLACHTVQGVSTGTIGPNLTDFATRSSVGAGLLELDRDNLRRWLRNPAAVKPGNRMAELASIYQSGNISLSDDEVSALIEYLLSLR